MPTLFLAVSSVGAAFTLNAYRPRRRDSVFVVPSFFAAWLTTELAAQILVVELVGMVGFAWAGALSEWPGWLGLGLAVVSWAGLVVIVLRARRTGELVDAALVEGLGTDLHTPIGSMNQDARVGLLSSARFILPVTLRDRRITISRDVRYAPGAGRRHLLDVYHPTEPVTGAPVLLQIHGGAWVIGNKRQQALPLMHHLAARNWVCVAANYRLSPRTTFPDHLVDVKLALCWIHEHINSYGGDPGFIAITGGSAGGHLAALAALTANDPEYQPGFEGAETSVSACVSFYGVYDLTNRFGGRGADGMSGLTERLVLKKRLIDDRTAFEKASPIERAHAGAPPFMIVHGTSDSLVPTPEARAFAERLRSVSRSPTVYLELPGAQHAFEVFNTVRADRVVQGVHAFLTFVHASYEASGPVLGSSSSPDEGPY